MKPQQRFLELYRELTILEQLMGLLDWDQQTGMPTQAAAGRGEQAAFLSEQHHARAASTELGELLDTLQRAPGDLDPEQVRVAQRGYERARRIPTRWAGEFARITAQAHHAWETAREASDFKIFRPWLERIVALRREYAGFFPEVAHPYDALLEEYEPGLTTAQVRELFEPLRREQTGLLREIVARQGAIPAFAAPLPVARQRELARRVVGWLGLDPERSRLDESAHPFTVTVHYDDLRITTNYDENDLSSFFSCMHEGGHALYELNIAPELRDTPLGTLRSLALHESQSRLWENIVGRGAAWLDFMEPELRRCFPAALAGVDRAELRRLVNAVRPGLIRVDADEVSYNLHIMLRFELEVALLTGTLAVADLPAAWNAKMQEYLGVAVPDDRSGVLQDVHWAGGAFGYFPTYAIGNLIAAQLWTAAQRQFPDWEARLRRGEVEWLQGWLANGVHRHGARYAAADLVRQLTGEPLSSTPYLHYLKHKFLPGS